MDTQNKIILILSSVIIILPIAGYLLLPQFEAHRQGVFGFDGSVSYQQMTVDSTSSYHLFINGSSTPGQLDSDVVNNQLGSAQTYEQDGIFVSTKEPSAVIAIDAVVLTKAGFVVMFENTFEPTGEFIAVSAYLSEGAYTEVPMVLFREVRPGERFDAVLIHDDGDKIFNVTKDMPVRNDQGNPVYSYVQFASES